MSNPKPARNNAVQKALDAEIRGTTMDDFDRFEYFSMRNGRKIIYVSIAVFVVLSLFFVGKSIFSSKDDKVAGAFAKAQTVEQLEKVIKDYGSSDLSFGPRMRYARLLIESQKYDLAMEQYEYLLKAGMPDEMTTRIKLDRAYALELLGKYDEAIAGFAVIADSEGLPKYTITEAAFAAGRIAVQQGQSEKGMTYLKKAAGAVNTAYDNVTYTDMAADFYARQATAMLTLLNNQK